MRLYRGQKIAELILEKQAHDARLVGVDRTSWYTVKLSRSKLIVFRKATGFLSNDEDLVSKSLFSTFHLSFLDSDTMDFLDASENTGNSICLQIWYAVMSSILSTMLTKTSINGILNRGGMFLFSTTQLNDFLQFPSEWHDKKNTLLDLGAGDGGITKILGEFFDEVYVTEMSTVMQYRLQQKGFHLADVEQWHKGDRKYDLISVLNLLDRHYNPRVLLSQLHSTALKSGCPVLMAVVLPVKQYVEFHPEKKNSSAPDTYIALSGRTFEEHASALVQNEFLPAGFEVIRWTKLPYLCEGDYNRPYYILYDALFLLRAKPLYGQESHVEITEVVHEEL